ncbi:FtsX-like permease family protein [Methanobacterium sp.]|uniref:FtsX-like permease family protein n=1 Tax=Methanobacterium sp. TaxID=2164 RepID=UPI003C711C51
MDIYKLSLKNLRRNRLRNLFATLRITLGVLILIILISSGLGLNTFLKQANSFNLESNGTNSQSIVTTIADQVNSFLGTNHSKSVVIEKIKGLINNIVYIVDGIASIVFLVGILDIINTMGFNLNERKREIAILKTLGFSKLQLLTSLSIEAGLLGLLGSIGGALIASIGLILAANIIGISISILIPPWLLIGVISFTTILCMILGILPAWFAVERDITEVLV